MADMMCLRDSPRALGPLPIGLNTLVAITTSSRLARSFSARPVTSSLAPSEYMSAVSKKLIPASSACLKNGRLSSSSSTHSRQLLAP